MLRNFFCLHLIIDTLLSDILLYMHLMDRNAAHFLLSVSNGSNVKRGRNPPIKKCGSSKMENQNIDHDILVWLLSSFHLRLVFASNQLSLVMFCINILFL